MPDFKNLDAVVETDPLKKLDGIVANPAAKTSSIGNPYAQSVGRLEAGGWENKLNAATVASDINPYIFVTNDILKANQRYPGYNPTVAEPEDYYAYGQSNWDKATNGLLKGVNLAGSTFVQGTAGLLYGIGAAAGNWKISSLYNNDFSNAIADWNAAAEDVLPNYQTNVERDAKWYQPDNWFKANFLWDSVVKNLGFSIGAIYSGGVVAKALKLVPALFNLSKAGILADVAATGEQAINAVPATERLNIFSSAIRKASESTLTASKLLSPIDRTLVSFLGAVTEGGIEAQQGLNEYRNTLIQQYTDKYGEAPVGATLAAINSKSEELGNARFGLNLLLLSATNYIQLPKILGASYKAEKNIANSLYESTNGVIKDTETGILRSALPTKTIPKLLYKTSNVAQLFFSPSEAFEEGAQYSIQTGVEAYYNKKNSERDVFSSDFWNNITDAAKVGISKTFSDKEGMESILIGGLSGGIQQAGFISKGADGKIGIGKGGEIGERGWTGYGGGKQKNTEEFVAAANKYKLNFKSDGFLNATLDATKRAVTLQEDGEAYVRQGDVLESKDNEFDYQHNYLTPRIKYGRYDLVKSDIDGYRQQASTPDGMEELKKTGVANANDTQQTFLQRLKNFENHADNVNSLYQSLNLRYSGVVNKTSGERVYSDDVIDKMVYAAAKVADYDQRIPQLTSELLTKGIDVQGILEDILINGTPSVEATKEALAQINALSKNTISTTVDNLKTSLQDVIELSLRRKEFLKEYDEIKNAPDKWKQPSEETPANTETIKLSTASGEKDIEIGTKYYLGKVVEKDKSGKEVYRFPIITVLGENADGTIKIKAENGNIRDISKAELEDYHLGKVEDTLSNKKAKFYMENINTIFQFNFGKGKKVNGRLQFSPKKNTLLFVYKKANGKIGSIEVTGDQFVAKEGFNSPMISAIGKLSAVQQSSLDNFSSEKDLRTDEKRKVRLGILDKLFTEVSEKSEALKKLIQQKYTELANLNKELEEFEKKIEAGELTKKNNFKASTNRAIKAANRLSRMKAQLSDEITELESQKDELEMHEQYISDMAQNIDELPTDSGEFFDELKEQRNLIESLILETGHNINSLSKIIDNVQNALDTAVKFIKDLLNVFESTYPKVTGTTGQEWIDFLKANPNFLKLNPNYKDDLSTVEDLLSQVEDLDVVPNERTLKELRGELDALNSNLRDYEKELKAKDLILSKFEEIAKEYKKQLEEDRKLQKNEKVIQEIFNNQDKKKANNTSGEKIKFEPEHKKAANILFAATRAFSLLFAKKKNKDAVTPPHTLRSNYFGGMFNTFSNKENMRMMLVHEGMPGYEEAFKLLTDYAPTSDDNKAILSIAVIEEKDGWKYVNQYGKSIGKVGEEFSPNDIVFQVMPSATDKWTDGSKATRSTDEEALTLHNLEVYRKQRADVLSQTSPSTFYEFSPSFGLPVIGEDKKPLFVETTPQPVSNIAPASELSIVISTNADEIVRSHNGTVAIKVPLGRPMAVTNNTVQHLNNRKLTEREQNTIFKILQSIAKFALEDNIAENEAASKLFDYLRGVVYWGIPKNDAGRNSIWFDSTPNGEYFLHIGNNKYTVPLSPIYLSSPEGENIVRAALSEMYNNTNIDILKKTDAFYEIEDVDGEGNITKEKRWDNYTSYLTSVEGRSPNELPLSTNISTFIKDDVQTREGIYFVLHAAQDAYLSALPKKQEAAK